MTLLLVSQSVGQVPGIDEALSAAKSSGHYESILVVIFFVTVLGFLVWLIRQWLGDAMKREERMAKRIDELEAFIRLEMKALALECREALDRNSAAVTALTTALHDRPCLADESKP